MPWLCSTVDRVTRRGATCQLQGTSAGKCSSGRGSRIPIRDVCPRGPGPGPTVGGSIQQSPAIRLQHNVMKPNCWLAVLQLPQGVKLPPGYLWRRWVKGQDKGRLEDKGPAGIRRGLGPKGKGASNGTKKKGKKGPKPATAAAAAAAADPVAAATDSKASTPASSGSTSPTAAAGSSEQHLATVSRTRSTTYGRCQQTVEGSTHMRGAHICESSGRRSSTSCCRRCSG
jgi:hypothetical protein